MTKQANATPLEPAPSVGIINELIVGETEDLCDATNAAIQAGGGFGWINTPERDVLERYWQGVLAMPSRILLAARLDGVICGTCQLIKAPANNEAQAHIVQLSTHFIAPWARGHGLAENLIKLAEETARKDGASVINLDVRETLTEAISLYEKLGFIRIGEHPAYAKIDDQTLKGYYYCKTLD